jgi:hypothetical protein
VSQSYECRDAESPPDLTRWVVADSPREAAERFAEQRDQRHVEFPPESEVIVASPNGAEVTFTVTLESVPSYSAKVKRANPEAR